MSSTPNPIHFWGDYPISSMVDTITPAQMDMISEIGGRPFFTHDLDSQIELWSAENPMTPAVVQQKLSVLLNSRSEYLNNIAQLKVGLNKLGIEIDALEAGQAELGFLLPRPLFKNDFGDLIKELEFIKRVLDFFSVIAVGSPERIEVRQISTTDPLFCLSIDPTTAAIFAGAITWALKTWKDIEEIRKLRRSAEKTNEFTAEEMQEIFDTKIEKSIESKVNAQVSVILEAASKKIRDSKEEAVRLSWALNSILSRVERGMRVELKFLPPKKPIPEEVQDEQKLARQASLFGDLERLEKTLEFPKISESPILKIPAPFVETPDKSSGGQKKST